MIDARAQPKLLALLYIACAWAVVLLFCLCPSCGQFLICVPCSVWVIFLGPLAFLFFPHALQEAIYFGIASILTGIG